LTVVREIVKSIMPLLCGAPFNSNRMNMEDLKADILSIFHADKVRYIPPRDETGEMTAYEVARRYQLAQKLLGPTYGNIIFHGLDVIIETTFGMMLDAGAFEPPPRKVESLRIQYESPLARAQRAQDVQAIQDTIAVLEPLNAVNGMVYDNINFDETTLTVARGLGFPANCLNSETKRAEIRDAKAKARQQAEALATMETGARAAADVAKLPPGTVEKLSGGS
jgi:hypothetical protein